MVGTRASRSEGIIEEQSAAAGIYRHVRNFKKITRDSCAQFAGVRIHRGHLLVNIVRLFVYQDINDGESHAEAQRIFHDFKGKPVEELDGSAALALGKEIRASLVQRFWDKVEGYGGKEELSRMNTEDAFNLQQRWNEEVWEELEERQPCIRSPAPTTKSKWLANECVRFDKDSRLPKGFVAPSDAKPDTLPPSKASRGLEKTRILAFFGRAMVVEFYNRRYAGEQVSVKEFVKEQVLKYETMVVSEGAAEHISDDPTAHTNDIHLRHLLLNVDKLLLSFAEAIAEGSDFILRRLRTPPERYSEDAEDLGDAADAYIAAMTILASCMGPSGIDSLLEDTKFFLELPNKPLPKSQRALPPFRDDEIIVVRARTSPVRETSKFATLYLPRSLVASAEAAVQQKLDAGASREEAVGLLKDLGETVVTTTSASRHRRCELCPEREKRKAGVAVPEEIDNPCRFCRKWIRKSQEGLYHITDFGVLRDLFYNMRASSTGAMGLSWQAHIASFQHLGAFEEIGGALKQEINIPGFSRPVKLIQEADPESTMSVHIPQQVAITKPALMELVWPVDVVKAAVEAVKELTEQLNLPEGVKIGIDVKEKRVRHACPFGFRLEAEAILLRGLFIQLRTSRALKLISSCFAAKIWYYTPEEKELNLRSGGTGVVHNGPSSEQDDSASTNAALGAKERPGAFPDLDPPPGCPPFGWARILAPVRGWQGYHIWGGSLQHYLDLVHQHDWILVGARFSNVGCWIYLYCLETGVFCPLWMQFAQGACDIRELRYISLLAHAKLNPTSNSVTKDMLEVARQETVAIATSARAIPWYRDQRVDLTVNDYEVIFDAINDDPTASLETFCPPEAEEEYEVLGNTSGGQSGETRRNTKMEQSILEEVFKAIGYEATSAREDNLPDIFFDLDGERLGTTEIVYYSTILHGKCKQDIPDRSSAMIKFIEQGGRCAEFDVPIYFCGRAGALQASVAHFEPRFSPERTAGLGSWRFVCKVVNNLEHDWSPGQRKEIMMQMSELPFLKPNLWEISNSSREAKFAKVKRMMPEGSGGVIVAGSTRSNSKQPDLKDENGGPETRFEGDSINATSPPSAVPGSTTTGLPRADGAGAQAEGGSQPNTSSKVVLENPVKSDLANQKRVLEKDSVIGLEEPTKSRKRARTTQSVQPPPTTLRRSQRNRGNDTIRE